MPPVGTVAARVRVAASALLAAPEGTWYLRTPGGSVAWAGRATSSGVVAERQVGPSPVAIASDGRSIFVAEALADGPAQPRTRVLEALDPTTLEVRRSVAVEDVIVDMRFDGSLLWILRADGVAASHDPASLAVVRQVPTDGMGPGFIGTWGGAIWTLQGDRPSTRDAVLTRIDRATTSTRVVARFQELVARAVAVTEGATGWLGLGDLHGQGTAVPVDASGTIGTAVTIGAPNAMLVAGSDLWWTSHDGRLGRVGAGRYEPLALGTATALAWDAGRLWAASEDLLLIEPAP